MMSYKLCVISVIVFNISLVKCGQMQLFEGQPCNLNDGTRGICKNIEHCVSMRESFRRGVVPKRCSFSGTIEYICCSDERPPPNLNDRNELPISQNNGTIVFPDRIHGMQPQHPSTPAAETVQVREQIPTMSTTTKSISKQTIEMVDSIINEVFNNARHSSIPSAAQAPALIATMITDDYINHLINDVFRKVSNSSPHQAKEQMGRFTPTFNTSFSSYELQSDRVCQQHYSQLPVAPNDTRDKRVNDMTAYPGELPHMAALAYVNELTNETTFGCGGVLISETFVLTAAHCLTDRKMPKFVRLGRVNLEVSTDERDPVDINIKTSIKHPAFNARTKQNDIALLELETAVEFSERVRPACLYTKLTDLPLDANISVAGWGSTPDYGRQLSNVLTKRNVRTMPLATCNATVLNFNREANLSNLSNGLIESQYCAHDPMSTELLNCHGDSGGPLMINSHRVSTVVGFISFGITCNSTIPNVYTRVGSYLEWIESYVYPNVINIHQ